MTIQNSNVSASGLVEKYIGTAYDNVKVVADNIDAVNAVADELEKGSGYLETLTAADTRFMDTTADLSGAKSLKFLVNELRSNATPAEALIGILLNANDVEASGSVNWATTISDANAVTTVLTTAAGDFLFANIADGASNETYTGVIEYVKAEEAGVWFVTSTLYTTTGSIVTTGKFTGVPGDMSIARFDASTGNIWSAGSIEIYKTV